MPFAGLTRVTESFSWCHDPPTQVHRVRLLTLLATLFVCAIVIGMVMPCLHVWSCHVWSCRGAQTESCGHLGCAWCARCTLALFVLCLGVPTRWRTPWRVVVHGRWSRAALHSPEFGQPLGHSVPVEKIIVLGWLSLTFAFQSGVVYSGHRRSVFMP